jgi:hypothetical protein
MRDKSDRYQVPTVPTAVPPKRIGNHLVDAGLLTADQIKVALNDQQATGMRFGEIVVARGWLKEQTVEWVVSKVVEPERKQTKPDPSAARASSRPQSLKILQAAADESESHPQTAAAQANAHARKPPLRREVPISKPLPPVKSTDGDVNWVG